MLVMIVSGSDQSSDPLWRSTFVIAALSAAGFVSLAWYRDEVSTREVLAFAVLFRLLAFPLLPSLSDDGFRYVWDGWLQRSGINPYAFRPMDDALASFHDSVLYEKLNSSYYYSVYPPASQFVFVVGGTVMGFGWTVAWYVIKLLLLVTEYGGVWALSRMTSARSLMLYAWHPLVVIEVAGQAHTEAGMVGFLLLALLAYRSELRAQSVAALTVAGWFKLYPLVLMPFLLRRVGWHYSWVAVGISLLLLLPFAAPSVIDHVASSLNLYVQLFEFNAGPYFLLKKIGLAWSGEDPSKTLGPILRNIFLLGIACLYVADYFRSKPLIWWWLLSVGLLWATATTVHPWYLLGILALLPVVMDDSARGTATLYAGAWLCLSIGSLGTYLFYTHGEVPYWTAVIFGWGGWAIGLACAVLVLGLPSFMRHRADQKWRWISDYLEHPTSMLDLGAGEGFVGAAAARDTGADVTLVDVVDFNRTSDRLVLYDGRKLPFRTNEFDTTVLVYVLHHAEDPHAVLNEARRVTSGRVAVLESIVETSGDQRWLEMADRLANRLRSGGRMSNREEYLHFKTVGEWRSAFQEAGFSIVAEDRRGKLLHKRHLFVLE